MSRTSRHCESAWWRSQKMVLYDVGIIFMLSLCKKLKTFLQKLVEVMCSIFLMGRFQTHLDGFDKKWSVGSGVFRLYWWVWGGSEIYHGRSALYIDLNLTMRAYRKFLVKCKGNENNTQSAKIWPVH